MTAVRFPGAVLDIAYHLPERVVRNAEREIAAARRREKRGDRDPNQVAGLSSVLPTPTDGVVLEFKPDRSKDT